MPIRRLLGICAEFRDSLSIEHDCAGSLLRLGIAICLTFATSAVACAECTVSNYRIEDNYIRANDGIGNLFLAVAPTDFTVDNLVCLSRALRQQNPTWREVYVAFFNSHAAYQTFSGLNSKLLHAAYTLNVKKHEEYLDLMPSGLDGPEWITHLDLTAAVVGRCRFELRGRCLLGFDVIRYPPDVLFANGAGTLSLRAVVERDGSISHIQVTAAEGTTPAVKQRLTEATVSNLSSWWLEPASRQDDLEITYSYIIDPSARYKIDGSPADPSTGRARVELDLPSHVTIRGSSQR